MPKLLFKRVLRKLDGKTSAAWLEQAGEFEGLERPRAQGLTADMHFGGIPRWLFV